MRGAIVSMGSFNEGSDAIGILRCMLGPNSPWTEICDGVWKHMLASVA